MIIVALALLGLCCGSFVNALVWRLHKQQKSKSNKYSILNGRSMCTHCGHQLATKDLLPVISWVLLKGKCRYCDKTISWQYPAVEAATAILFITSYLFWPSELAGLEWLGFGVWLVSLVGLVALAVYDIRYMLLPNKIIFPLIALVSVYILTNAVVDSSLEPIKEGLLGLIIGGGVFYVLFQVSSGKWIGGGDVKLGFLLGLLVGGPGAALLLLFVSSLLGTIAVLPLMATKKITPKTRVPFGPFLIAAAVIVMLFGQPMIEFYLESVGLA